MNVYKWLVLGFVIAVGVLLYWVIKTDEVNYTHLDPGQTRVTIQPKAHRLIVTTPKGQQTFYLPDNKSTVTVDDKGKATVQERVLGFQHEPGIGYSYSDKGRLVLMLDLLYWHNINLGVGLGMAIDGNTDVRASVHGSYNVYNNTFLFIGVDHTQKVMGGLYLRF